MNADQVTQIIQSQTESGEPLPNSHSVELFRCLVKPTLIKVIHRKVKKGKIEDSIEIVWLVLEENPVAKDGYKIVYNEQRESFGLASVGFASESYPILCGYYGDFPTTLASM